MGGKGALIRWLEGYENETIANGCVRRAVVILYKFRVQKFGQSSTILGENDKRAGSIFSAVVLYHCGSVTHTHSGNKISCTVDTLVPYPFSKVVSPI